MCEEFAFTVQRLVKRLGFSCPSNCLNMHYVSHRNRKKDIKGPLNVLRELFAILGKFSVSNCCAELNEGHVKGGAMQLNTALSLMIILYNYPFNVNFRPYTVF